MNVHEAITRGGSIHKIVGLIRITILWITRICMKLLSEVCLGPWNNYLILVEVLQSLNDCPAFNAAARIFDTSMI